MDGDRSGQIRQLGGPELHLLLRSRKNLPLLESGDGHLLCRRMGPALSRMKPSKNELTGEKGEGGLAERGGDGNS